MPVYEFANRRDSKLDASQPRLTVEFVEVVYNNQGDHEYVPHIFYDTDGIGAHENLGPMDFEMSWDGLEIYVDGVADRAQEVFNRLGDMAWQSIANELHGQIPLAKRAAVNDYEDSSAEVEEIVVAVSAIVESDLPMAA